MSWHHIPKDDAWKQAHLEMLVSYILQHLFLRATQPEFRLMRWLL